MGKHPDFAQPLLSLSQRLGCHLFAGLVQIPLSHCLSVGKLFPEPLLALILGLKSRERIGLLSSARLGQEGRAYVENVHDLDKVADRFIELYGSIL